MSNRHWLLRAPLIAGSEEGWQWRHAAAPDTAVQGGTLAEFAAALPAGARVLVLLPVSCALVVPVVLPQKQQRQLLAALPFLLEESIACDIERLHVIAGTRLDAQSLQAIAVEHDLLGSLLAQMQAVGIDPDIVTLDALALPAGSLLVDGACSLLHGSDGAALAFDMHDAALVAATLPPDAPLQLLAGPQGADAILRTLEATLADPENPAKVSVDATPTDLLDRVATLNDAACARLPNLRQAGYAKAGSNDFALGFDWRPLAWLAACWVVVSLGYQVAAGISYQREAEATKVAQADFYRQLFPGSNNVPYPRKQMQGQLGAGTAADGLFISLVARTSAAVVEVGGAAAGYQPGAMAWDSAQRRLRVDVQARSLEDIDKLRAALEGKGLAVDLGAGVAQAGGYKARVNVGEGA